jgi:hypothetical protein
MRFASQTSLPVALAGLWSERLPAAIGGRETGAFFRGGFFYNSCAGRLRINVDCR